MATERKVNKVKRSIANTSLCTTDQLVGQQGSVGHSTLHALCNSFQIRCVHTHIHMHMHTKVHKVMVQTWREAEVKSTFLTISMWSDKVL